MKLCLASRIKLVRARQLAEKLTHYMEVNNALVMALPRGGVPVIYVIYFGYNTPITLSIVAYYNKI
jgi:predicted phosphoribosyltransferase